MASNLSEDQGAFLRTYGPIAHDIASATGLDPSVVLGQVALETGWGKHVSGNNIFGISPGGSVAAYPSVEAASKAYVDLIKSRYAGAVSMRTPEAQAQAIASSGYNPFPDYAPKVSKIAADIRAAGPHSTMSDADLDQLLTTPTKPPPAAPAQQDHITAASDADLDGLLLGNRPSGAPGKKGEIDPITGQPFQFAETSDNNPVAQSLNRTIAENRVPGPATQAIAGLPTDPEQRRRVMAGQIFPGMPPGEAQSRVFYGPNNRLAAVDPSGSPFYVDPQAPSLSGRTMGQPISWLASGAGGALPVAGGIAGGLLGGPSSMVIGPAGAAAGAAAGDLARQYGARAFDPASTPQPIDFGQTAREAAASGVGQFVGAGLSNALAPNALRVTPGEVQVMRTQPVMADTRGAYGRAATQGVDLTPGQATGLPSLLQYEDAATTMPATVDRATGFYRNQGKQLAAAGENMLSSISPNADKTDAALMFSQGAQDATRSVRQAANKAARPAYRAAEASGNIMSPDLAQLADLPAVQTAMTDATKTYRNLYGKAPPETPDFALWDLTKRQLDDAYSGALRDGKRTDAMAIDSIRQRVLSNLDTAYPTYPTAREIAAPGQRLASQLEDSGVGTTANAGIDEKARAIVAPVFNQNPRAISQAREAFANAGRADEWNAGVRSYIQDAFDRASQSQQGLNPSMLRRQVWGNVDNRAAIEAALTPQQYTGFDNFMKTVEDVARTFPMNSLTATRLNARGALSGAAENQANVRAVDAAATILSPFRMMDIGTQALGGVRQRMVQSNVNRIVGHLFSPDGLQYLEAMSAYSPTSQRAIEATSQLLGRLAGPSIAGPGLSAPSQSNLLQPAQ